MMPKNIFIFLFIVLFGCKSKIEKVNPVIGAISESIYASGIIKSKNQYEAFVTVSGNIDQIFVAEGDTIKKGTAILSIANRAQELNRENAGLSAEFADINANQGILNDAILLITTAKEKMKNDSSLFFRQKSLWKAGIGTKMEYEARELNFINAKSGHSSAKLKYNDLKRQLNFASSQSKKNLLISRRLENDYTLRSEIDGIVYSLPKEKGEVVSPQMPLAIIGDANNFILQMQVDESDILQVQKGLRTVVVIESYKDTTFEAIITKISPLMNEKSKTFLVEATFLDPPKILYPNISFEANIVLQTKQKSLLIPRNYLLNDSLLIKRNGDTIVIKTGLKDYQMVEIISGISLNEELKKPVQ